MLSITTFTPVITGQIELNRVPSGTGIDFLVWPAMIAAFVYIVYVTTRKKSSDKGNKDDQN
jgi:hypothetical protein